MGFPMGAAAVVKEGKAHNTSVITTLEGLMSKRENLVCYSSNNKDKRGSWYSSTTGSIGKVGRNKGIAIALIGVVGLGMYVSNKRKETNQSGSYKGVIGRALATLNIGRRPNNEN